MAKTRDVFDRSTFMTDWVAYSVTIGGTTTAPTKGTTPTSDYARWRRVGDSMEIMYDFQNGSGGSAGSGEYIINIPSGYTIDTTKVTTNGGFDNQGNSAVGSGTFGIGGTFNDFGSVHAVNTTGVVIRGYGETSTSSNYFSSSTTPLSNASAFINITFKVPIVGWSANQ